MSKESFTRKLRALSDLKKSLPDKIASQAVNFVKERFVLKNWVDGPKREPWPPRKKVKGKKLRGSLMIVSGRLKRSIRKYHVSSDKVIIGTDVPYASVHNRGGHIRSNARVRAHTRKIKKAFGKRLKAGAKEVQIKPHARSVDFSMPGRTFMAPSRHLQRRIEWLTLNEMKKAMRSS